MCAINLIMSFKYYTLLSKPKLTNITNVLRQQYGSKTIIGERVVDLTDSTLLGRIMSYLNTRINTSEGKTSLNDGATMINNLVHGNSRVLKSLSIGQLEGLFYSANTNVVTHSKQNMIKVLDLLDVECCLRVNNMDSAAMLKILNAYMHVIPNRITEYKFYQYATDNFERCLNHATKEDLLQYIFYIGLQKNTQKPQMMLRKCLRIIDKNMLASLTVEDLCIICNSMYRTHIKITNKKILDKVKDTLNNNLYLLKDPALLITLIKTMKHNRCQDDDILSTIKCTIFFNKTLQYYTFPALCHILSLYADDLYYDEDLLKLFMDKCIKYLQDSGDLKLKTTYLGEQLRPKDITRFLWILSILGYTNIDKDVCKNVIIPNILKRINAGQYKNHPEEITDTILYLRMLNYPGNELISYGLSPNCIARIKGTQSKHRLNLLLTIIKHEDEELFKKLDIKRLEFSNYNQTSQIQVRTNLQRVFKALNRISHDLDIKSFEMNMQIPHLNIVGISAYKRESIDTDPKLVINIEVLDESNCVKNKDCSPTGYMKLKLRILEQMPLPLITIQENDIVTLTEDELETFLKDEFQLIIY